MTATRPALGGEVDPGGIVRVGVNLLWLVPGAVGGSEEYTTRALRGLVERPPDDLHLTLFVLRPFVVAHPDLVASLPTVSLNSDGRSRPRRVAAESTWLARQAEQRSIDLLHHAGGVVPPGPAVRARPSVLTIHDLQPLVMPENFSPVKQRWLAAMLPRSVREARMVATPSDQAAASVVERLGVPAARVATVPHGIALPGTTTADEQAEVMARFTVSAPFVLYPAITHPHKDHDTLLRAFALLAVTRPDLRLVLTGGEGRAEAEVRALISTLGLTDRVRRLGRIPRADLDTLFDASAAVAVPSLFEGFGAPALEAMAHGAPLLAAATTALPEVVGDAGVLVPPGQPTTWADALSEVLDDPALAAALSAAGRARAAQFTWDRTAAALAAVYRRAARIGEDDRP